jgi:predicted alpha/beta-fold hydrolase
MTNFILLILFFVVLFALFLFFNRKQRIYVEFSRHGSIAPIIASMPSLTKPYIPTPWLIEGYLHTAYAMRRPSGPILRVERCEARLDDGGTIGIEVLQANSGIPHAPFVVIGPPLGGSSRDRCVSNLARACAQHGWRVAIANARGCAGVPFTSSRLTFSSDFDHLEAAIESIQSQYQPKFLFLAGFSMGAVQAMRYNCYGKEQLDGCVAISHPHHCWRCWEAMESRIPKHLFTRNLVTAMRRQVTKNNAIGEKDFTGVVDLISFDEKIGHKYRGDDPKPTKEAFEEGNIYDKIPIVRSPTLIVASQDDPMTKKEFLPIKEARSSERVALVHTKVGGHIGFLTGWYGRESIIEEIVPEFFETIIKNKGH